MKAKSIIQPVHDRRQPINARIAYIEGRRYIRKPTFFRNMEDGREFYSLVGSLAFPIGKTPGFAVILGVVKDKIHTKVPVLEVLKEIEEPDLMSLLASCVRVRHKWGYPYCLKIFIGDAEMYLEAIATFNSDIEDAPDNKRQGLYISPPSDFMETRRDIIYLQTVKQLLSTNSHGYKRLLIGNNPKLRAHLQNVPPDLGHVEDVPALAALAYATHTILATTPWLQFTQPQRFEPTIQEDGFAQVNFWSWEEGRLTWDEDWDGNDDDGEENSLDDGELVGTI